MAGRLTVLLQIVGKTASAVAVAAMALLLISCRPMYGPTSQGNDPSYELASIAIDPIPGRVGQRIRNELIFLFTGGNHPAEPKYKLEIVYRESVQGVLFKRTDDATGKIYSIDATYVLRDISGKTVLSKGSSHARAAYDKPESVYSNVRAERDAKNRAARDIARDINNRVAAYISSNG